jgi:hypothetical protein
MKSEKIDNIKSIITAVEISIDTIKKNIEIVKYLTDNIHGMANSIDYYITEIENDIKTLKINLGIRESEEFE